MQDDVSLSNIVLHYFYHFHKRIYSDMLFLNHYPMIFSF